MPRTSFYTLCLRFTPPTMLHAQNETVKLSAALVRTGIAIQCDLLFAHEQCEPGLYCFDGGRNQTEQFLLKTPKHVVRVTENACSEMRWHQRHVSTALKRTRVRACYGHDAIARCHDGLEAQMNGDSVRRVGGLGGSPLA